MTSLSLRDAAKGHVQAGQAISVSSLAANMLCPMARPISVRKLIGELTQESHVFPTWNFDGGYISAWAQLGLNADGTGSFRGHVHDSGPIAYDYVVTTVLLDVKDQSGNTLVFAHEGTVHGTFDIGSRDDDWQDDSFDCLIAEKWDLIKTSRTWSTIHTSNNVLGVLEHIVLGMVAAVGIVGIVLFGGGVASGEITCHWQLSPGDHEGVAIDVICTRGVR